MGRKRAGCYQKMLPVGYGRNLLVIFHAGGYFCAGNQGYLSLEKGTKRVFSSASRDA